MPKVLIFDIETAPMLAYVWGRKDVNVALNQVKSDWYVMAWAAKWLGDPATKVIYKDQRNANNVEDDSKLIKPLWKLLDEADVVITQNGKAFDVKKLNTRFIIHGMTPPSPYQHIDTYKIVSKHAAFTSSSLEYLANTLCTKYKKLKHGKYPGMELWKQCLAGNKDAWNEMRIYNTHDVLATEELYTKIQAWDTSVDFNIYRERDTLICNCGNSHLLMRGHHYNKSGKYQRYKCRACGKWYLGRTNLLKAVK